MKAGYCRLADHKEWVQLADLFTEDASARFYDPIGQIRSEIKGQGKIARKIGTSVGAAQPINHIFSAEFVISSPTEANAVNVVWAMEDRLIRPRYRIRRNSARNDRRRVLMATLRPRGDGNDAATLISIPIQIRSLAVVLRNGPVRSGTNESASCAHDAESPAI